MNPSSMVFLTTWARELEVLDAMGKKMELLVNDFYAAGDYKIGWSPSIRHSCTYILQMRVGHQMQQRLIPYIHE